MSSYYNRNLPSQYYKIGSNYENQDYAYKNIEPEKNFLNKQIIEEERKHELNKARQVEEFSAYARNTNQERPSSYVCASKNNYDHLTGKIGQEQRYDMKYGIPRRATETISKSYFRNPRSHLTHGYNIVSGTICNVLDNNEPILKNEYQSRRENASYSTPYQQQQRPQSFEAQKEYDTRDIMKARDEYDQRFQRRGESCSAIEDIQPKENETMKFRNNDQQLKEEYERRQREEQLRKIEYEKQRTMQMQKEKQFQQEADHVYKQQLLQSQERQQQSQLQQEGNPNPEISEEEYKRAYENYYRQEQEKHQQTQAQKTPAQMEEEMRGQLNQQPNMNNNILQRNDSLNYKKITPLNDANPQQSNIPIPDSEYQDYLEYMKQKEKNTETQGPSQQIPQTNNPPSLTPHRVVDYGFIPQPKQQPQSQIQQQQGTNTPQISKEEYLRLKKMQQEELEYQEYKKYLQEQQPKPYNPEIVDRRQQQQYQPNQQYSPYESEYVNRYKSYGYSRGDRNYHQTYEPTGYNQDRIMKTNPYSQTQNNSITPLPFPGPQHIRSSYITSNPYSTKSIDLGKSSLPVNPIIFPVNSYKFNYDRFLNPSYSGNRLINIGNNIVSK